MPSINFRYPESADNSSYTNDFFPYNSIADYDSENYINNFRNTSTDTFLLENPEEENNFSKNKTKDSKEETNKSITIKESNDITKSEEIKNNGKKIFSIEKITLSQKRKRESDYDSKNKRLFEEYNIRNKIARNFCNKYLIKKFKNILIKFKCPLNFYKFQENFVSNISSKNYKFHLYLTLEEIISNKELYKVKKKSKGKDAFENYYLNLTALEKLQLGEFKYVGENTEVNSFLNKKFCDLFQDYLNSDEFNKDIKRMKKAYSNTYIERYIEFSKNFIENYKN